jgi:hypothetical protein
MSSKIADSAYHREADSRIDKLTSKYKWTRDCGYILFSFVQRVLADHDAVMGLKHKRQTIAVMQHVMKKGVRGLPPKERSLSYREEPGEYRSLAADLNSCLQFIDAQERRYKAALVDDLEPIDMVVFNLAPFFRCRAGDLIGWRDVVRFLDCIPNSPKLAGRKIAAGDEILDKKTILDRQAERISKLYRRIPQNTPRDPRLSRLLARRSRHRSISPMQSVHTRAFKRLKT